MALSRFHGMGLPATQVLEADVFSGLRLYEHRAGDAHEARLTVLDDEVHHHGVIGLPSEAWTHQQRYLRNDA